MTQPKWKFVANLGDVSWADYGGLFVFRDLTGVYDPEMEYLEPPTDDHVCPPDLAGEEPEDESEEVEAESDSMESEESDFEDFDRDPPESDFEEEEIAPRKRDKWGTGDEDRTCEHYAAYRVPLERQKEVTVTSEALAENGEIVATRTTYLVPMAYDETYPKPVSEYQEWFVKDLASIAATVGMDVADLRAALCSENILDLANAYRAIADHHGWHELDSYPLMLSRNDIEKRYADLDEEEKPVEGAVEEEKGEGDD